jgi:D-alanyl-D-alanine endopeptidase (penicillin-binding protein 7)
VAAALAATAALICAWAAPPDAAAPLQHIPQRIVAAADDQGDDLAPGEEATLPPRAFAPVLASGNTNLSFAHRAGLHRTPNPLRLTASVALAMDARDGQVLYARNERAILPIASLTKLLTGIVVLEARLPMSERIRITRDDVDTLRHSRSRLRVGTTLTRAHALQLALMSSENRAAHALARTFPGGVPAFVARMNRKAKELGMEGSRFVDPAGLSNGNRATARDVATLVVAASKYTVLRQDSTTKRHVAVFKARRLQYLNSNRLVRYKAWPIELQKTGYIVEAGHCMAMLTRTRGRPVVLVLMDAGSVKERGLDARKLRVWVSRKLGKARAARK